jgi:hypothetical protein
VVLDWLRGQLGQLAGGVRAEIALELIERVVALLAGSVSSSAAVKLRSSPLRRSCLPFPAVPG